MTASTAFHDLAPTNQGGQVEAARLHLEQKAAALRDLVPVEVVVRASGASAGIVACAAEKNADLVVVGSHGRTGWVRWMLGSQTDEVLHHAHSPVLITH